MQDVDCPGRANCDDKINSAQADWAARCVKRTHLTRRLHAPGGARCPVEHGALRAAPTVRIQKQSVVAHPCAHAAASPGPQSARGWGRVARDATLGGVGAWRATPRVLGRAPYKKLPNSTLLARTANATPPVSQVRAGLELKLPERGVARGPAWRTPASRDEELLGSAQGALVVGRRAHKSGWRQSHAGIGHSTQLGEWTQT